MSEWWELAIPVLAALAGAVVGAASQAFLRRGQFSQDRRMRLLDEKLHAYSQLSGLLTSLPSLSDEIREEIARQKELRSTLEEQVHELEELNRERGRIEIAVHDHGSGSEFTERLGVIDSRIKILKTENTRIYNEMERELKGLPGKVNRFYELLALISRVSLWGSYEVMQAISRLELAIVEGDSTQIHKSAGDLRSTMRDDLTT